jgi:glucan phosphoethanolaminetransferase (alkaline phosphatase superfamily)
MSTNNNSGGGLGAIIGRLLILFFFFYFLYLWATHPNAFVRLTFWIFMAIVAYSYYQEFDLQYYRDSHMTNEEFLKSLK